MDHKAGDRFKNRVIESGRVIYSVNKKLRAEDALNNFSSALKRLQEALEIKNELIEKGYKDIYLDLTIKRFEFTYEMSWKCIKRFLDYMGIDCKFPRSCIQEAYAQEIISEEETWLDMIESRNLTSHIYDELEIKEVVVKIEKYIKVFNELGNYIREKL